MRNPSIGKSLDAQTQWTAQQIEEAKGRLRDLVRATERNLMEIGDLIYQLHREQGIKLDEIAKITGWKKSRLSQFENAARAFPKEMRQKSVCFEQYHIARSAAEKTARQVQQLIQNSNNPEIAKALSADTVADPVAALREIQGHETPTRKLSSRDAQNLIAKRIHKTITDILGVPHPVISDKFLNRCHHLDCNALLKKMRKENVTWKAKFINLDPPYGAYCKLKDGRLDISTSAAQYLGGDNLAMEDAIATTIETISFLPHFLDKGGTIALWQDAGALRLPILRAIEKAGLVVEIGVVWNKNRPQPGDFNDAWARQTEMCWMLHRPSEEMLNHNQSSRGNVLSSEDERFWFQQTAGAISPTHIFKKPEGLSDFLIQKHTHIGEIVLDLYGCTGTCSMAAISSGRQFIYCESFLENFATFSQDVLRRLEGVQKNDIKVVRHAC